MKKLRSILALVLALVMAFTFIACGNNQSGDDDATPTPSAEPTGTDEIDYSEGGKYLNLPGATGGMEYRLPKFEFTSKEVVVMASSEIIRKDFDTFDPFYDAYELQYKTTIASATDCITKFIALYMADDSPDVCLFNYETNLVNKGYLSNWLDYIDTELDLWADIRTSIEESLFKGGLYGMAVSPSRGNYMIFYNKEIFEELGVKTPDEYLEEGNWNWDTFTELVPQLTVDNDADGIPEIYGLSVDNPEFLAFTTGEEFVIVDGDNVINNMRSENVARGINKFVDIVNMDGVSYAGDNRTPFGQGSIAMMQAPVWYRISCHDLIKRDALGLVPTPRDPQADKYYIEETFGGMSLPSNAKNPWGAAAYVTSQKFMKIANANDPEKRAELEALTIEEQIEKTGWTVALEDKLNTIYGEEYYPVHVWAATFRISTLLGEMYFRPLTGEPWATVVEEVYPAYQAIIEEALEAN